MGGFIECIRESLPVLLGLKLIALDDRCHMKSRMVPADRIVGQEDQAHIPSDQ